MSLCILIIFEKNIDIIELNLLSQHIEYLSNFLVINYNQNYYLFSNICQSGHVTIYSIQQLIIQVQLIKIITISHQQKKRIDMMTTAFNSGGANFSLDGIGDQTGKCLSTPNGFITEHQQQRKNQLKLQIDDLLQQLDQYKAYSKCIDMNKLRKSSKITTKKYKEAVYFGEVQDSKKNGAGIMLYANGRFYQGEWKDNFKSGKGFQKFQNGAVYEGMYSQGKPSGFGRYQWPNGQKYQGQWVDGLKHGSGIWRGSKGDSYIGQWRDGQADGYGVHTWINGDRYEGQFKNCLKHGEGVQKFANGDIYKGFYENGKPSGYGQYFWSTGSFFKGNFKNGLRDGDGNWKRGPGNSDKYEGQYHNDKKQGYGIFTWANGNVYKGNYVADMRQGYGQLYSGDGLIYKGQWVSGQQVDQYQNEQIQEQAGHYSENLEKPKSKGYSRKKMAQLISQQSKSQYELQINVNTKDGSYVHPLYYPASMADNFFDNNGQEAIQKRPNNYHEPLRPFIQDKKQFRARGLMSNKSARDKPLRSQNQKSNIYMNNSFHSSFNQPQLNKKYSLGTRLDVKTSSKKQRRKINHDQQLSASFFLYKINNNNRKNEDIQRMLQSQQQMRNHTKIRAIKTSGSFRQKKIAQELSYFTQAKINRGQFF